MMADDQESEASVDKSDQGVVQQFKEANIPDVQERRSENEITEVEPITLPQSENNR